MRKLALLISIIIFMSIVCKGQCSEVIFSKKDSCEFRIENFVKRNVFKKTITIIGDYIHGVDSVKIWKCETNIYSDRLNNDFTFTDGYSFMTTLATNIEGNNNFFLQLDNCFYFIVVPENTGLIKVEKISPVLTVDYYSLKQTRREEERGN
jgi:hypothetical protein